MRLIPARLFTTKKRRNIFRSIIIIMITTSFTFIFLAWNTIPDFKTTQQEVLDLYNLEQTLTDLEERVNLLDTSEVKNRTMQRMWQGWIDFATWTEQIRAIAHHRNIEMAWRVDSLETIHSSISTLEHVAITLTLKPNNHSLENTLGFAEQILLDPKIELSVTEGQFVGDTLGLDQLILNIKGWLRP
jgi:hypothetical protein